MKARSTINSATSNSLHGRLWLYGAAALSIGLITMIRNKDSVNNFVAKAVTKIIKPDSKELDVQKVTSLKIAN